jgi:hypothetical protein
VVGTGGRAPATLFANVNFLGGDMSTRLPLRTVWRAWFFAVVAVVGVGARSGADDSFFRLRMPDVKVTGGQWPKDAETANWRWSAPGESLEPYVRIDDAGEGYFVALEPQGNRELFLRAPGGKEVTGKVFVPVTESGGMARVDFVAGPEANAGAREAFYGAKATHYERLADRQIPGGAWFRYQAAQARQALGKKGDQGAPANQRPRPGERSDQFQETFALFSGGRALSENLQLDRAMRLTAQGSNQTVQTASLRGIDVREMDWKGLIKDMKPQLDPLAKLIPADQHAVFFPSFAAFTAVVDEADRQGTPVVQLLEPRSEESGAKARYQRQLCLSLTGLGRILGPQVIDGVAVTGSDPYLRVGSDVAVLLAARDVGTLRSLLEVQLAMNRQTDPGARAVEGKVGGVAYTGAVSPDRAVSSYMIVLGDAVVVSNSLAQLERLAAAHGGRSPALSSAPEYTFFRNRYKRGEADESALLVLSDATIRRWCGPRWRIADSRRTRAAAVMTARQAEAVDALVKGTLRTSEVPCPEMDLGKVEMTAAGVVSSDYGRLDFMTPIIEMPLETVTKAEADAYGRWRDSYQQNWSQYFDPIAIRLGVGRERMSVDLTVMPLIARTEYGEMIEASRGAKLSAAGTDAHDPLVHFALAVNKNSAPVRQIGDMGGGLKLDFMGWLGQSVSLYVDDDPFWGELAKAPDAQKYVQEHLDRLPVAVSAEVSDPAKLVAFLTAARAFIEGAAPGMTQWTPIAYPGGAYTRISLTENGRRDTGIPGKLAIHYAATPDLLVISPNEDVVKRAIDRHAKRDEARKAGGVNHPGTRPWLGSSAGLQVDGKFADGVLQMLGSPFGSEMQARAWGNIPILNEWKRLYPDQDPVKLHERLWQARLVCPGGGSYAWNEQYLTMESTVYGHPGQPKKGPGLPPALRGLKWVNFGMDFEENGLRARGVVERAPQ